MKNKNLLIKSFTKYAFVVLLCKQSCVKDTFLSVKNRRNESRDCIRPPRTYWRIIVRIGKILFVLSIGTTLFIRKSFYNALNFSSVHLFADNARRRIQYITNRNEKRNYKDCAGRFKFSNGI